MTKLQHYQMFIDGKWVDAADGRTFTSMNPSTGDDWSEIPEATAADVNRAVEAAHRAFTQGEWATALPTARGRYLRRLADLLAHLGVCQRLGDLQRRGRIGDQDVEAIERCDVNQ